MNNNTHPEPGKPASFCETHCMKCQAGWVRKMDRSTVIICLLDREPVPGHLTACNKFQAEQV